MPKHEREYVLLKRLHRARVQFEFNALRARMNACLIAAIAPECLRAIIVTAGCSAATASVSFLKNEKHREIVTVCA
jgi:hypothetical protein